MGGWIGRQRDGGAGGLKLETKQNKEGREKSDLSQAAEIRSYRHLIPTHVPRREERGKAEKEERERN